MHFNLPETTKKAAIDIAREYWGKDMPGWIRRMAQACDASSQAEVGRQINRSSSTVCQVLKKRYAGDMAGIERRFKTAFQTDSVLCPIMGRIGGQDCLAHQDRPYNAANFQAVRLFRACKTCPNAKSCKEPDHAE